MGCYSAVGIKFVKMENVVELIFLDEFSEDIDCSLINFVRQSNDAMNFLASIVIGDMISADEGDQTVRIPNYYENTVPSYSDVSFRAHFRMSRSAIEVRYSQNS